MNNKYLSDKTILESIRYLQKLQISEPKIFGDFLLLKYIGISKERWTPYDNNFKKEAIAASKILMCLYSPKENLPDKYELIDPFKMKWSAQSLSESAEKYGPYRLWNNIAGGSQNWRTIIDTDTNSDPKKIRFRINYANRVKELCEFEEKKINLSQLACWIFRFNKIQFESDKPNINNILTKSFLSLFNFNDEEKKIFFIGDPIKLEVLDNPVDAKVIRQEIGPPPKPNKITIELNKYPTLEGNIMNEKIIQMTAKNPSVEEIYEYLKKAKQIILFGPPGTSKTYYAKHLMNKYFKERSFFIQIHQNYSYEEFIGGFKFNNGNIEYQDGILIDILNIVRKNPGSDYLLVIDEINRGNLSKIFGELFVCLDRENTNVTISSNKLKNISLPDNLNIIGTMNSSDRSIALVDNALRRRFKFIYLSPDEEVLAALTEDSQLAGLKIITLFNKINDRIIDVLQNKELKLGHTFFMPNRIFKDSKFKWTFPDLEFEFNNSILPLIEEYCYGNEAALVDILGSDLINRLKGEQFNLALKRYLE